MSRGGYQSIREQLVALNVDLDDKKKICAHLEDKIQQERAKLSQVEADLNTHYDDAMESEFGQRQREMERLRGTSDTLVNEKKQFVQLCKVLVDTIREEEADLAAEGRRLNREALESLDLEKKAFRASHPDRLQKFLASKATEEKEKTEKALQPEFSRLQHMHERELAEAEAYAKSEERKLREEFQVQLEGLVKEEREAHLESQKNVQRNRHNAVAVELDASDREHRMRLLTAQSDAEKDLDKLKTVLANKVERERKEGQAEVITAQENFQRRVHELRSRHMADIAAVMKDQDEQLKAVRSRAEQSRDDAEARLLQDRYPNSALQSSAGERATEEVREEVHRERDRKLQQEIRALQAESVRLERMWKGKAAEEREFVLGSRDKEEKESARRHRQLNEETAEVMALHEQMAQDVRRAQDGLAAVSAELEDTRKEIDVYEGGIAAHRNRIKDMQSLSNARLRDDESSNQSRVDAVRSRLDRMRSQLMHKRESTDRELADLESHHVTEMETLDRQVKAEVARKDEDLDLLRDAVHSEKVKIARLEKLAKQQRNQ